MYRLLSAASGGSRQGDDACDHARPTWLRFGHDSRGSVALVFALCLIPLIGLVGLAIDYSFYIKAQAQVNLAADAAALHAVRVASSAFGNGLTTAALAQTAGNTAGQQWFDAQIGKVANATIPEPTVNVVYTASPGGFTATVTDTITITTFFGKLFKVPTWKVTGTAATVISNAYDEIVMMLDNSSSMMLPSTTAGIISLEQATPCSTQSANAGQGMEAYSWGYGSGYGYYENGMTTTNALTVPPNTQTGSTGSSGSCTNTFTGGSSVCFYVPSILPSTSKISSAGSCTNGGGATVTATVANKSKTFNNVPQAPCAFACHTSTTNNDYYGLARSLGIQLRLDVVLSAASNVITSLQAAEQSPNQFTVGVYQFAADMTRVYPTSGAAEGSTNLTAANTATNAITTPVTSDNGNTDFPTAMTSLIALPIVAAGDGTTAAGPLKNLFIVTDGLNDTPTSRIIGTMDQTTCTQFKSLGFNVYVLYTPYLPVANPFYLQNVIGTVEPTGASKVTTALQNCASQTANFFQASDPTAINSAMQTMLTAALNTAGRISK